MVGEWLQRPRTATSRGPAARGRRRAPCGVPGAFGPGENRRTALARDWRGRPGENPLMDRRQDGGARVCGVVLGGESRAAAARPPTCRGCPGPCGEAGRLRFGPAALRPLRVPPVTRRAAPRLRPVQGALRAAYGRPWTGRSPGAGSETAGGAGGVGGLASRVLPAQRCRAAVPPRGPGRRRRDRCRHGQQLHGAMRRGSRAW